MNFDAFPMNCLPKNECTVKRVYTNAHAIRIRTYNVQSGIRIEPKKQQRWRMISQFTLPFDAKKHKISIYSNIIMFLYIRVCISHLVILIGA